MIHRTAETFNGQACIKLDNGNITMWATTGIGPRLLGMALDDGQNLFAELPDLTLDCPGRGEYHFYGGHRLWHAPEEPRRTYLPDDVPIEAQETEAGLRLIQPTESATGIQKQIELRLHPSQAQVEVEHFLTNQGRWPVELAPWAITQFKTGGKAILPMCAPKADPFGVLSDRNLALWPYTDLRSPHLHIGRSLLILRAQMTNEAFKIGFRNYSGWLAYLLNGTLFVKRLPHQPEAEYFDRNSSSECYCGANFIELESLGPKVTLAPGETVSHLESWELFRDVLFPEDETGILQALQQLGIHLAAQ
ncbi:MAG: hypothetical protein AB1894_23610 [Chloroflexota bacterium]